jgi:hypothetical protein
MFHTQMAGRLRTDYDMSSKEPINHIDVARVSSEVVSNAEKQAYTIEDHLFDLERKVQEHCKPYVMLRWKSCT